MPPPTNLRHLISQPFINQQGFDVNFTEHGGKYCAGATFWLAARLANSPRITAMEKNDLEAIHHRMDLADAKLGVAKDLGWVAAGFAAVSMYLLLESWLAAIGAFVLIYVVAIYKYRKDEKAAADAYERAHSTDED